MFIGISGRLKSKRVDKQLQAAGYSDYEIFYSPLSVWATYCMLLPYGFGGFLPIAYNFLRPWIFPVAAFLAGYILIARSVASQLNNTFAITNNELVIVNPYFPFKKITSMKLDSILSVRISNQPFRLRKLFLCFDSNFIEIATQNGETTRFYCHGLEQDFYDENLTEKTIENLVYALEKRNIKVEYLLK